MEIKAQPISNIEHPRDGIGDDGINEVRRMLVKEGVIDYNYEFDHVYEDIGSEWVVKKGKFAGTFPKRLAKAIKKKYNKKIDPQTLGNIGELAKRHTVEAMGYKLDFTAVLDWRPGDFGDEGSCYWGDCNGAREMMEDAGGLAVRFYDDADIGYGRAWMLPYGKHWVIFNAYGRKLTTITIARILATEMGWSYKKVRFHNNGESRNTLYINGGVAHLIGETGKIEHIDRVDLCLPNIHDNRNQCENCHDDLDGEYYSVYDHLYCNYCYDDLFFYCNWCETDRYQEDSMAVWRERRGTLYQEDVCRSCIDDTFECIVCNRIVLPCGTGSTIVEDEQVCVECIVGLGTCDDCNRPSLELHTTIEYPRDKLGRYDFKVTTTRCYVCHDERNDR